MRALLVPILSFTVLKLVFTLVITFDSLEVEMVIFFIILTLMNIHLLISCVLDRDLLPKQIKKILIRKKAYNNEEK
tara:strand:+ start:2441 stop:2668 length:228 start_codon:yes stop_codon:yes gene_type:complete